MVIYRSAGGSKSPPTERPGVMRNAACGGFAFRLWPARRGQVSWPVWPTVNKKAERMTEPVPMISATSALEHAQSCGSRLVALQQPTLVVWPAGAIQWPPCGSRVCASCSWRSGRPGVRIRRQSSQKLGTTASSTGMRSVTPGLLRRFGAWKLFLGSPRRLASGDFRPWRRQRRKIEQCCLPGSRQRRRALC